VRGFERRQNLVLGLVLDYEKGRNSAQGFERHQNSVLRLVQNLERHQNSVLRLVLDCVQAFEKALD
jgi:hypothetical protein